MAVQIETQGQLAEFLEILENYVATRYGVAVAAGTAEGGQGR